MASDSAHTVPEIINTVTETTRSSVHPAASNRMYPKSLIENPVVP